MPEVIDEVRVERKQPCVMQDGTVLYADVYRPREKGLFPVLLMRQPYGRTIASTVTQAHPVWYANRGFMVVIQDVRGRGDSEGNFDPFVNEAQDGYESVEWAAGLSESNGNVGMYGFSYQGSTQWAAASLAPPSLKAIAPAMCGADTYHGMIYPQGRFAVSELVPWAFQLARDGLRRGSGAEELEAFCSRVRRNTPDELLYPVPEKGDHPLLQTWFPAYAEWCARSTYDAYWKQRSWISSCLKHAIPSFLIGGWYDVFLAGTWLDFKALAGQPVWKNGSLKLCIGPWKHIPWGRYAGGIDHGPEAGGRIHLEQADWFRHWLAGEKNVEEDRLDRAVTWFERGSNTWRSLKSATLVSTGTASLRYRLTAAEQPANGALGDGRLHREDVKPPDFATSDVFVYDARLPMPLHGYEPLDRRETQERQEILVYTGEPSGNSIRLFGEARLFLKVQTLGGPTDIIAVLSVLRPDGSAEFLTIGRTETYAVDEGNGLWQSLDILFRPMAVELRQGEAIRLEITGSAYPLYALHPNGYRLEDIHTVRANQLQMVTVCIGYQADGGSWLDLPVIMIKE